MKNRPEITDEEIRQYMNFDALQKQFEVQKHSNRQWLRNTVVLVAILTVGIVGYVATQKMSDSPTNQLPAPQEPRPLQADSVNREAGEAIATTPAVIQPQTSTEPAKKSEKAPLDTQPSKKEKAKADTALATVAAPVYEEAVPVEGYPHLYEYFRSELHYPEAALKDSIQGVVTVSFVINAQGKPEQVVSQNSLGEVFDKEVLRLIENMPAWKPALLNGQPVRARISIPLTFQIVNKPKN